MAIPQETGGLSGMPPHRLSPPVRGLRGMRVPLHSGGGACHATNRRLQSGNHQVQFPQYADLADQSVPVLKMLPEAGGSMTWQRKSGLLPRPCASSGVW
ncbi:MAG: hypothetical protein DBY37_16145 [Desulfovibrionaceae bacterium]|nr:MAG: hypothetical protein DBY37_16145 [Desulfovibrionaceae bacterium]